MIPPILAFRNVWKTYGPVGGKPLHALHDVSIEVARGATVAIIGRSGSGKSTFLHLAAGIDEPSSGHVEFDGRDLADLGPTERTQIRRRGVGLVFQFFHLLPHLRVLDNVVLPAMIAGDRRRDSESRGRELLQRVGLEDRAAETVQKLSGGEMQRVAICRALLRRPRLLLADEPTGNLDDENGRRVMDLLLQLADEEGSSLIYVTHSLQLASRAGAVRRLHSGILETA